MGFADEMGQFDDEAEAARQEPRRGILPDGTHQAQIVESRVEERDGRFAWVIKFSNDKGSINKWNNLDNEIGRKIAIQDADDLGYTGPLSGLQKACESEIFLGIVCEINVKTKAGKDRDYTNVYLNKVLGKRALPEPGSVPASTAGTDDDIPF